MLEDKARQHDQQVVDKYHDPTANYTMTTRDYVMRPKAVSGGGSITITLPPVTEAKGRFYSIAARDADGTNTVIITDQSDSECWKTNVILDSPCDGALFYSDGLRWFALPEFWPETPHTRAPDVP